MNGPGPTREDREKLERLKERLAELGNVAVAYSGGVDSTFLLAVAEDVLQDKVIALTAVSPLYLADDIEFAKRFAESRGIEHHILPGADLSDPCFQNNPKDRCFHCKLRVFSKAREEAEKRGVTNFMDATNSDDLSDYRPGMEAAKQLKVLHPLLDAGLGKAAIRRLGEGLGLPGWDRPSQACLASRFPHGVAVTRERLSMVDRAEQGIKALGFKIVRVRFHDDLARIELGREEIDKALDAGLRKKVYDVIREAGFKYAALDLAGYRTGSMNPDPENAG